MHFEGRGLFFNEKSLKLASGGTALMTELFAMKLDSFEARPRTLLRSGDIMLVSALWLLQRPSDYIVQRFQDLPPEALVEPAAAAHLYACKDGLAVLSYPWLSKQHPDPSGFHLKIFQQYLAMHMR